MRVTALACLALSLGLCGCAGPMTPFGALNGLGSSAKQLLDKYLASSAKDGVARLSFYPQRQKLHGSAAFSIVIEDAQGVPEDFGLTVFYNGQEVGRQFLLRADREYMDPNHRMLKLTSKYMRLLPSRENQIYVVYQREPSSPPVALQYQPPRCSAFEAGREVASLPEFDPSPKFIRLINENAGEKKFNPFFVAGLIAQESAFDPRAISVSKAMGLTQVTSLGEGEIVKRFAEWPRYPGVAEMPVPVLKLAVATGEIRADNEWRLNPELSIRGGVEYLAYINQYWNRPDKRAQLAKNMVDGEYSLSEIMLASYNSGPSRVSDAIEKRGPTWMQDEELGEARKYVRRVTSYCDHFANTEE